MAQTKHEIQSLLAEAGSSPRHRFGQNFMIDGNLVRIVADGGQIAGDDLVIEVGPGTGTLTDELLARGAEVLAVEIDRDLAAMLRNRFSGNPKFTLIEGDALAGKHAINAELLSRFEIAKKDGRTVKLVANLPYNIASPLTIELLIAGVNLLAFTVQKEVADRFRATVGSDDYGPLSVMAQSLADVEVLRVLPPQAFWPMPKIESALVRLVRNPRVGAESSNDAASGDSEVAPGNSRGDPFTVSEFGVFVHKLFSARRKTLRRALLQMGADAEKSLAAASISGTIRPEELSPPDCLKLFRAVTDFAALSSEEHGD
jgi:16S rRNA (adenine1518-N6/adenine1519-N6)-dimethyltransferase